VIAVDSSAIIAIFAEEADADLFHRRLAEDGAPVMSAAGVLECSIVIRSFRSLPPETSEAWLDEFLLSANLTTEPIGTVDLRLARDAHMRFGKGTGHPAQLNFGDCFSYALARRLKAPLLFKGSDFAQTDVVSAL
jgi:ribonuclease VapC